MHEFLFQAITKKLLQKFNSTANLGNMLNFVVKKKYITKYR